MIYVDTSVIIAALTPETATARVHAWLAEQPAGGLVISGWILTEVSSALAIKVRTGALQVEHRAEILAAWYRFQTDHFQIAAVTPNHFEVAARFADQHELALRAGDALHLAIASSAGYHIATLDRVMGEAAPKLGVPLAAL
jgi:predicted nucleic acid-binding protein